MNQVAQANQEQNPGDALWLEIQRLYGMGIGNEGGTGAIIKKFHAFLGVNRFDDPIRHLPIRQVAFRKFLKDCIYHGIFRHERRIGDRFLPAYDDYRRAKQLCYDQIDYLVAAPDVTTLKGQVAVVARAFGIVL